MPIERGSRSVLVQDSSEAGRAAVTDLVVPSVLLRAGHTDWTELVHLYVPRQPTVAFTSRDVRSPGIRRAAEVAREAGFAAVVRSPGGRMVAYDSGAVVVDHLTRPFELRDGGSPLFAQNAQHHAAVLRALGADARVGEVPGEYCPGEHSVNIAGRVKVVGSAQRITGTGALFSTVVQVAVSSAVHDVIVAVSAALGYDLAESTIGGLADAVPGLAPDAVLSALAADYRDRLDPEDASLGTEVLRHAAGAVPAPDDPMPFDVDAWTRAHPLAYA